MRACPFGQAPIFVHFTFVRGLKFLFSLPFVTLRKRLDARSLALCLR